MLAFLVPGMVYSLILTASLGWNVNMQRLTLDGGLRVE